MINKKFCFKNIIDYILILLIAILSIKKGGFYKTDTILFNLGITFIGIIYILFFDFFKSFKVDKNCNNSNKNIDIIEIILLGLTVAYTLPILFENYSNLSDSIFEMIRYFNIFLIYKIVKKSDNKKIYLNSIIMITLLQCFIGIDGLGNRYIENILKFFNSGFLDIDLKRLSGTIQYANVVAIMIAISIILIFEKIYNLKIENKKYIKYILYYISLFILTSSLILTETRNVMLIIILSIIIYIFKNNKDIKKTVQLKIDKFNNIKNILTIISVFILSLISSSMISNYSINFPDKIYFVFFIGITISFLLSISIIYFLKFINKYELNKSKYLSNKNISVICAIFIIIYLIIGMNISNPIYIYSDSKQNNYNVNLYNLKTDIKNINGNLNNIEFDLNILQEDTRYNLNIIEVNDKFESRVLKTLNYYETVTNKVDFDFYASSNAEYISVNISTSKGSLSIDNIIVNKKTKILNYALFPSNVLFKINDLINGSTSVRDRIIYVKDSFKIITNSPKNFFIGVGGEGFKNMYELYQSFSYSSTEVHNSFIQIFVESGIIGLVLIILVILITFIKGNKNISMLCFFILILHSAFDLNMSYMFIMCIFALILGTVEQKIYIKFKLLIFKKYILIFELLFSIVIIYILIKANIAYYMQIPFYEKEYVTNKNQIELVNKLEKRVKLDSSETKYREKLNDEYYIYLQILLNDIENIEDENKKEILRNEANNLIQKIKLNADMILYNDKYNKYTILNVSNIYFKNLDNFVYINYNQEKDLGYKKYLEYIISNIDNINEKYIFNKKSKEISKEAYTNYYNELKEKNIILENIELEKVIKILDEKVLDF